MKFKGCIALSFFGFSLLFAQQNDSILVQELDEIILKSNTILGNEFVAKNRTGSSYYITPQELKALNYTDINRVLTKVPGVNFYEEDGFGLRPNISLRGTSPERSAKITLMEDGVLIAPAPYSSPAAYYFPTIMRMEAVEILKGSSQIHYGPFTSGGAINMVSKSIPEEFQVQLQSMAGSFESLQFRSSIGNTTDKFGYLIEVLNHQSSGFKNLGDNQNSGFDLYDVSSKLNFSLPKLWGATQEVSLKYHIYDEKSNETYAGLSTSDFENTPFDRYAGSQIDQMNAQQTQFVLTHTLSFSDNFKLITHAYDNRVLRNWYKLDDVVAAEDKQKLSTVIANPELYATHYDLLSGALNSSAEDALLVKANNRVYNASGLQTKFDLHWYGQNNTFHDIEIGLRFHRDEEDRFQWEDAYSIDNGLMQISAEGIRGNQGNRISYAEALASYVSYKYKKNGLTLTPGLRFENIKLYRDDFGKDNPQRSQDQLSSRSNTIQALVPGMGFNYTISRNASVFGGVHKGFSPAGSDPNEKAESSVNYELGSRFGFGSFSGELVGFFNDYSNLLGNDLAASGGTGTGDPFNAGETNVSGLEFLLNYKMSLSDKLNLPISFSYTLTDAIFQNDFGSSEDLWGEVQQGDRVPFIPQHQFNLSAALNHERFDLNWNLRYNGDFNTQAFADFNNSSKINAYTVLDFSAAYTLNTNWRLKANVINMTDEVYAVSTVPAGLRPGHPFGAYIGFEFIN